MKTSQLLGSVLLAAGFTMAADDNPYADFPSVPRTATINGFADPVYDSMPACARSCLDQDVGLTPCPYWDTGCLCVIQSFAGAVANCIADSCQGSDVDTASSVAYDVCVSVGAGNWFIPESAQAALASAAAVEAEVTSEASVAETTTESTVQETSPEATVPETSAESTAPQTSAEGPASETSAAESAPETSAPATEEPTAPSPSEAPVESSVVPPPAQNTTVTVSSFNAANNNVGSFIATLAMAAGIFAAFI